MRTVTPEQTTSVVHGADGARYEMVDYLGSHAERRPGEQAYLVRQQAPELRAHFHEVDQFQVVVEGRGTLGRAAAVPGVVHYTDAYTSYGPIRTDPAVGLGYLTLRRDPTTGLHYMPEEREARRRAAGHGEHFTVVLDESTAPGPTPTVLARTGRGAGAWGARLPAGERLDVGGLPTGQAGYVVVVAGSLSAPEPAPAGSLISFESADELIAPGRDEAGRLPVAGPGGATLAVLLFGSPA